MGISVLFIGTFFVLLGVLQILGMFNIDKYFDLNKYLKIGFEDLNEKQSKIDTRNKTIIKNGLKISFVLIIIL